MPHFSLAQHIINLCTQTYKHSKHRSRPDNCRIYARKILFKQFSYSLQNVELCERVCVCERVCMKHMQMAKSNANQSEQTHQSVQIVCTWSDSNYSCCNCHNKTIIMINFWVIPVFQFYLLPCCAAWQQCYSSTSSTKTRAQTQLKTHSLHWIGSSVHLFKYVSNLFVAHTQRENVACHENPWQ